METHSCHRCRAPTPKGQPSALAARLARAGWSVALDKKTWEKVLVCPKCKKKGA